MSFRCYNELLGSHCTNICLFQPRSSDVLWNLIGQPQFLDALQGHQHDRTSLVALDVPHAERPNQIGSGRQGSAFVVGLVKVSRGDLCGRNLFHANIIRAGPKPYKFQDDKNKNGFQLLRSFQQHSHHLHYYFLHWATPPEHTAPWDTRLARDQPCPKSQNLIAMNIAMVGCNLNLPFQSDMWSWRLTANKTWKWHWREISFTAASCEWWSSPPRWGGERIDPVSKSHHSILHPNQQQSAS